MARATYEDGTQRWHECTSAPAAQWWYDDGTAGRGHAGNMGIGASQRRHNYGTPATMAQRVTTAQRHDGLMTACDDGTMAQRRYSDTRVSTQGERLTKIASVSATDNPISSFGVVVSTGVLIRYDVDKSRNQYNLFSKSRTEHQNSIFFYVRLKFSGDYCTVYIAFIAQEMQCGANHTTQ